MYVNDYIPSESCGAFLLAVLGILSVMLVLCLVKLIQGPDAPNRILAINMTCGISIAAIIVVSLLLGEPSLLDVALLYGLISFLAVVILSQVYIAVVRREKKDDSFRETGTPAWGRRKKAGSAGKPAKGKKVEP